MHTAADLSVLEGLVNGVNVKLEKAGGLRSGLKGGESHGAAQILILF